LTPATLIGSTKPLKILFFLKHLNQKTMKKFFAAAIVLASLTACNNAETEETLNTDTSNTVTASTATAYTPAEGDATYRDGQLLVWKNNEWVEADNSVKMDNDVVVYKNGEVKKDDNVVVLEDGEVVSHTGKVFDKTGQAIEDAWDATKKGVEKAGKAVEKAAQKTGDAVDGEK
jgi:hypothetical protein